MSMPIDDTLVQENEARLEQIKSGVAASKVYMARGTQTTAQNTAQIRLLTQAVLLLIKDKFDLD